MTPRNAIAELQSVLDKLLDGKNGLKVLEAGCGSATHIRLNEDAYLVGIDISAKQLERNLNLNEKILGDVQYHRFEPVAFDLIICWDVLEHLSNPELALDNFSSAIKDGGIIILKMPNFWSFKGLVTKCSPLWFHTVYYKYIFRSSHAVNVDDFGPFKTYLKSSISLHGIEKYTASRLLNIIHTRTYDVNLKYKSQPLHYAYKALANLARIVSLNRLTDSELIIVIQKNS
jgi:SAM-dependent methyltransferase